MAHSRCKKAPNRGALEIGHSEQDFAKTNCTGLKQIGGKEQLRYIETAYWISEELTSHYESTIAAANLAGSGYATIISMLIE